MTFTLKLAILLAFTEWVAIEMAAVRTDTAPKSPPKMRIGRFTSGFG